jgi:hypothetical protein
MSIFKHIFHQWLAGFREFALYHHSALEFRAKLFAVVIAANPDNDVCEDNKIKAFSQQIYDQEHRQAVLIQTVDEYLALVRKDNGLDIDELIDDIVKILNAMPRYNKKIDIDALKSLQACTEDEESRIYQDRIIDFLASYVPIQSEEEKNESV